MWQQEQQEKEEEEGPVQEGQGEETVGVAAAAMSTTPASAFELEVTAFKQHLLQDEVLIEVGKTYFFSYLLRKAKRVVQTKQLRRIPGVIVGVMSALPEAYCAEVAYKLLKDPMVKVDLICCFEVQDPPVDRLACRLYGAGSAKANQLMVKLPEFLEGTFVDAAYPERTCYAFQTPNLHLFQQLWVQEKTSSEMKRLEYMRRKRPH